MGRSFKFYKWRWRYFCKTYVYKFYGYFCTDRFIDIELILEEETGLKIPNSSIVEKEFFIVPKDYVTQGGNGKIMAF